MMWEEKTLDELYDVYNGLSKPSKYFGEGYPFLSFSAVFNNYFVPKKLSDLVQTTDIEQKKYSILRGDVFITRTSETINELGMSCVALDDYPYATFNGFTKRMRPKNQEIVLPEYIGYFMRTNAFRNKFNAFSTMTTRASLRNEELLGLKVLLPSMETQKRIADILSAYDNLIENNQKQIKLLEEMAQRLYKEWFVDLRFPNYENTEIVDGVPKGWKVDKLGHYVIVNSENLSSNYNGDYIDYVDIGSVSQGRILKKTKYALREAPGRAKRIAHDGDTIWGMVRPNLKAFSLVLSPTANEIYSTGFAIVTPKSIPYTFLHCFLTQDSFIGYLVNCTNGAAYPAVKPIHFEESNILIPNNIVLNEFHEKTDSIFRKIHQIDLQINLLQQARDRLLPKLMNRELEV